MFLENKSDRVERRGWIEVITGSMFSGKTEELLRRMRRASFSKLRVELYKPMLDTRYSDTSVVSHDRKELVARAVDSPVEILDLEDNADVIGIDEAQFFDDILVDVCRMLADRGIRVVVAGLDMDYTGKPFGCMPKLLATAEYITKEHAICMKCGGLAQYSHRTSKEKSLVVLGETDHYEPLCRRCFLQARAAAVNEEDE